MFTSNEDPSHFPVQFSVVLSSEGKSDIRSTAPLLCDLHVRDAPPQQRLHSLSARVLEMIFLRLERYIDSYSHCHCYKSSFKPQFWSGLSFSGFWVAMSQDG